MSKEIQKSSEAKLQQEELRRRMLARLAPSAGGLTSMDGGKYASDTCLLLDISGSMQCYVGDSGMRSTRIKELRKLAGQFPGVRKFWYNHDIQEMKPGEGIPDASGGNDEALAFRTLKRSGIRNVIMLTDGGSECPREALEAAKGLKIDICYIGDSPEPDFLRDLARVTGGSYHRGSLAALKSLETTVKEKLAICAPREEKKGAIIL